jgi:hypothetical protein
MTTTLTAQPNRYEQAVAARAHAAHALYEAELALHDARQTGVDEWMLAASNHLHVAVLAYTDAEGTLSRYARGAGR